MKLDRITLRDEAYRKIDRIYVDTRDKTSDLMNSGVNITCYIYHRNSPVTGGGSHV